MSEERKSLNEEIYKKIKYDIMDLVLLPGEQVSVQKLADRYQTTRAPIQVAIVRLSGEGLMDVYPKSRTEISRIDRSRLSEEWFMRRTLELAVVEEFCKTYQLKDLKTLQDIFKEQEKITARRNTRKKESAGKQEQVEKKGNLIEFYRLDNRMHKLFYTATEKELLWDTIDETATHYNRLRILSAEEGGIGNVIMDEHGEMLQYLKEHNWKKVKTILEEHLDHVFSQVSQLQKQYPDYFTSQEEK